MDKDKQPGIRFDSIMLVKEEFLREPNVPEEAVPDFNIGMGWSNQDNNYIVEINTTLKLIYEGKETLKLDNTFVGIFSVIESSENMNLEDFIKNNSAAIMFPYIREHISSVTQKSGVKPVLLPPINIIALLKKSDE
jgi:preprotein translocase subunit SecB